MSASCSSTRARASNTLKHSASEIKLEKGRDENKQVRVSTSLRFGARLRRDSRVGAAFKIRFDGEGRRGKTRARGVRPEALRRVAEGRLRRAQQPRLRRRAPPLH